MACQALALVSVRRIGSTTRKNSRRKPLVYFVFHGVARWSSGKNNTTTVGYGDTRGKALEDAQRRVAEEYSSHEGVVTFGEIALTRGPYKL